MSGNEELTSYDHVPDEGNADATSHPGRSAVATVDPAPAARAAVHDAVDRAQELAHEVKAEVSQVGARARGFLDEQLGARTKKTAEQIGQLAKSVIGAGEQLGETVVAPYVHKLGTGLQQVSSMLEEASVDEAVRRAEGYARANPLLFLGGALLAGVAGGRVLKSAYAAVQEGVDDVPLAPPSSKDHKRRASARHAQHGTR